jgi:hypothetical protein
LILLFSAAATFAQMAPQNPSPSTETTRPHPRIAKVDVPGERVEIKSLKGAVLFISTPCPRG